MLRAVAQTSVLPSYTYATLPAANTVPAGYRVRASDIGIAPGMALVSDGTRWIPDGPQVLARSGEVVSHTGNTNETTLATITVPAGLMGISGSLRITADGSGTNNANVKTLRVKLGATTFYSFGNNNFGSWSIQNRIRNRGAANSQVAPNSSVTGFGSVTSSPITGAIDTSAAAPLLITGQLATGTDTIALEGYTVEVLP